MMNFLPKNQSIIYARMYDDFSASLKTKDEIAFYKKHFSKQQKLIEFGCGTGRLLLPLLEDGYDISGMDISGDMLKVLKKKLKKKNLETKVYQKNLINFRLKNKFNGGILTQSTLNFITNRKDQKKALLNISKTLEKGSLLIINLMPVKPNNFAEIQKTLKKTETVKAGDAGKKLELWESWIPDPIEQTWKFIYEFRENNKRFRTKIKMRTIFPAEMINLLELCGFKILEIYGNWKRRKYDTKATALIFVAKKEKSESFLDISYNKANYRNVPTTRV